MATIGRGIEKWGERDLESDPRLPRASTYSWQERFALLTPGVGTSVEILRFAQDDIIKRRGIEEAGFFVLLWNDTKMRSGTRDVRGQPNPLTPFP